MEIVAVKSEVNLSFSQEGTDRDRRSGGGAHLYEICLYWALGRMESVVIKSTVNLSFSHAGTDRDI